MAAKWHDLGPVEELKKIPLQQVKAGRTSLALSYKNGTFGAVSGACNHVGGPLGEGCLDGEYLVCPWHYWKFHRISGEGEPGYEADRIPRYELKEEQGHLLVNLEAASRRNKTPHSPHPLAREPEKGKGSLRVLGISTTAMDPAHPRYSTSEALLETALEHARKDAGAETKLLRLSELSFRACEGFYSKGARACTWPCSITQMDKKDQMAQVYEGMVHWADAILVATPIRWGAASSLYYKMVERMNCVQNQITTHDRILIRDKVVSLIITGGQDNIQAVAGQMLGFFAEIGCVFPPFPYIAHSRGWSAEDMENNVRIVKQSEELHGGARELMDRTLEMAAKLREAPVCPAAIQRGGRKAHQMS